MTSIHIKDTGERKKRGIADASSFSAIDTKPTMLEIASDYIYMNIVPSPLVAKIQDDDITRDVTAWDVVNVNMTSSYDPDVERGNQTGMQFYMFCYTLTEMDTYQALTLDELLDRSTKITNNTIRTAHLYEPDDALPCFINEGPIWLINTELVFKGELATSNDTLVFDMFVTKDERIARSHAQIRVWSTNITVDNALDAIDALLASGDTSAALLVIDMATDALNIDDTGVSVDLFITDFSNVVISGGEGQIDYRQYRDNMFFNINAV